jgi:xylan 1,4-beta-xylosidase
MDETHSNSYGVWQAMGKPQSPAGADYARLEAAGQLAELESAASVKLENGKIILTTSLPRQGVSLIRLA